MDKIFGVDNFINEICWSYKSGGNSKRTFARKHDVVLFYSRTTKYQFNVQYYKSWQRKKYNYNANYPELWDEKEEMWYHLAICRDVWDDIFVIGTDNKERIGYPTQKPESLLERIITASTNEGGVVADFFSGGGTTPAVAQRLNRRWIACDQSRIATAITADRVTCTVENNATVIAAPDFTVEHWGTYESPRLEKLAANDFRKFVIEAYGGRPESAAANIHGLRAGVPLFVGEPSRKSQIGKEDVRKFAQAIFEEKRTEFGVMLGWNFDVEARRAAEILKARENKRIDFVRLTLVRLEDKEFREHITNKHKDYAELLSFIQPPEVRVEMTRIGAKKYRFDVSESVSLNPDGKLANVQWDFDYRQRFTSTPGYSFHRETAVEYEFDSAGKKQIACSVQDNQGGERTWTGELDVK